MLPCPERERFDLLASGKLGRRLRNHTARQHLHSHLPPPRYEDQKQGSLDLRSRAALHEAVIRARHETIIWATKSDHYHFDLDSVRVPQKYPNKRHYKGPNIGQLSGNPLGKNPGDVWHISNVKNRHSEKTSHPCQFPEELVERLVMSMSKPGQVVLDPFAGSGTVGAVCNRLDRRSVLIERSPEYVDIIRDRLGGSKPHARTQVSGEIALDPSIDDLFSVDQTSTINPGSNPVPSTGYPLAFETILVEPTM